MNGVRKKELTLVQRCSSINRTNMKRKCNNKIRTEMQTFFFQGGLKTNVNNWQTRTSRAHAHSFAHQHMQRLDEWCVECDSSKFLCFFFHFHIFLGCAFAYAFFCFFCCRGGLYDYWHCYNTHMLQEQILLRIASSFSLMKTYFNISARSKW